MKPREIVHTKLSNEVEFDLWRDSRGGEGITIDKDYLYESDVVHALFRFVRPGDFCLDAGCNLGYHTIIMSKLVGENGEVLAFDPDTYYFDKMKANLELNGIKNVCAFPIPLWSGITSMPFFLIEDDGHYQGLSSFIKYGHPPSTEVKVITRPIDAIIAPGAQLRLMKLDVEGAEEHVLRGAENTLKKGVDCVIVELNYKILASVSPKEGDRAIRDYMQSLGYDMFILHYNGDPPTYIPPDLTINVEIREGLGFHYNAMFSKRELVGQLWGIHYVGSA